MKLLVWISVLVAASLAQPGGFSVPQSSSGALEVIKRLGESRAGDDVKVTQGRSKAGDSPIFFIKLPPSPYYFRPNAVPSVPSHSLEKLPVSFVNNGKPHRVHHWNLPLINAHRSRPFQPNTRLRPQPHLRLRPRPNATTSHTITTISTTKTKMTKISSPQQPKPQPELGLPQQPQVGLQQPQPQLGLQQPQVGLQQPQVGLQPQPQQPHLGLQPQQPQVGLQPQQPQVGPQPQLGLQPQPQQPHLGLQPQPQQPPSPPSTTTAAPPHTPPAKTRPSKPWVSFKKGFAYNGRPSSVYVWSPVKSAVKTPVKTPVKIFMRKQPSENIYFGRSVDGNDDNNE